MKKYVYLFELDSVRNTDEEIKIGQRTLYDEIVGNGNVVVLTYNQLVDSRGFFSLLDIPEYHDSLIALFEKGNICISQYGDIRTISQYLLNSFDYEKEFIYSGWPLKSTQRRLLALIKRSLMYSDLSEIYSYVNKERTEEEVRELFVEVDRERNVKELEDKDIRGCMEILENLYWLLKTVLRLSALHEIYIDPRDTCEYADMHLSHLLEYVSQFDIVGKDELWRSAVDIISSHKCGDNRSRYLHAIKQEYSDPSARRFDRRTYQFSEAIVNIAYNFACEISICNISKHYDISELRPGARSRASFEREFISRLKQYWELGDLDNRFLMDETDVFDEFTDVGAIPKLSEALRITGYSDSSEKPETREIHRYEFELTEQRRSRRSEIQSAIRRRMVFSLICIVIACIVELLFQDVQGVLDRVVDIDTRTTLWSIFETLLFLGVTEGVTTLLSTKFPSLLSLSDALGGIGRLLKDAFHIRRDRVLAYCNAETSGLGSVEEHNESVRIDLVRSAAMKKYQSFRRERPALFRPSEHCPIADTGNNEVVKELAKLEEMFNFSFGVVYSSRFNTLVIDPIEAKSGAVPYFPYERLAPTAGSGVVMVTVCRDRLILLRQYRHAPRKEQIAFPRGFAEKGELSLENAERELREELGAVIAKPPVPIGRLSQDSGLTSCCAHVYLVELESYEAQTGHEGILSTLELTGAQFDEMLKNASPEDEDQPFDDGFTLGAYLMYKKHLGLIS